MNESDTRLKRITPALERAGWEKWQIVKYLQSNEPTKFRQDV